MSGNELYSRFEMAFGGICSLPEAREPEALLEVAATTGAFEKLVHHWKELPEPSRPRLRGITVARKSGKYFELLLDLGGKSSFLLLTVDWTGTQPLPRLAGIWPYAQWWEEELRSFENANIDGSASAATGIAWRRN